MQLTEVQTLLIILSVAAGTMLTRFTPFFLFPETKEVPKYVTDLGKMLPPAMMGMLVVYCFKGVSLTKGSHGIYEAIATIVILLLHKWKNNVLISIIGGTAVYMFLIQGIG